MRLFLKILKWLLLITLVMFTIFITVNWAPDRSVEELKLKWAQTPSQFIEVDGMQVHLRDEGPAGDPVPIVLLHGTSASLHTWDGWVNALKDERRVIRFDMPAFGLTGPSLDNNYSIESYSQFVVSVLDELKVEHYILAGNSLGGYVAWATALLHPDRVKQLILIDSSGYPYNSQSVPLGFTIANTPVINKLMEYVLPRSIVENSLKNVYGSPSLVTPELIDRYYDLTTRAGNRGALVERFIQTQPGTLANKIPEINIPTLILWGGRDNLIPAENADRFHKEISGSKLVLFNELGHVPQEEDPEKTVNALKTFLNNKE
jgi:pimeloyl-ACP methyl ester carboxylesterase